MLFVSAYELTGRIEPPAAESVFLHGATVPFEPESGVKVRGFTSEEIRVR